jgi:hypothetical protein
VVCPPSVPKATAAKPHRSPRIADSSDEEGDDGDVLDRDDRDDQDKGKENEAPPKLPSKKPVTLMKNPYAKKAPSAPSSHTIPSLYSGVDDDGNLSGECDKNNAGDIAMLIRNSGDIFKDQGYMESIKNRAGHSEKHGTDTETTVSRFFSAIAAHSKFGFLAELVEDPEARDIHTRRLYLICRGTITDAKKEILNTALLLFGETCMLKTAGKQPDPTKMGPAEKAAVSIICCLCLFEL